MTYWEKLDRALVLDALTRLKYDHPVAEISRERERVLIREAEREAARRHGAGLTSARPERSEDVRGVKQ